MSDVIRDQHIKALMTRPVYSDEDRRTLILPNGNKFTVSVDLIEQRPGWLKTLLEQQWDRAVREVNDRLDAQNAAINGPGQYGAIVPFTDELARIGAEEASQIADRLALDERDRYLNHVLKAQMRAIHETPVVPVSSRDDMVPTDQALDVFNNAPTHPPDWLTYTYIPNKRMMRADEHVMNDQIRAALEEQMRAVSLFTIPCPPFTAEDADLIWQIFNNGDPPEARRMPPPHPIAETPVSILPIVLTYDTPAMNLLRQANEEILRSTRMPPDSIVGRQITAREIEQQVARLTRRADQWVPPWIFTNASAVTEELRQPLTYPGHQVAQYVVDYPDDIGPTPQPHPGERDIAFYARIKAEPTMDPVPAKYVKGVSAANAAYAQMTDQCIRLIDRLADTWPEPKGKPK